MRWKAENPVGSREYYQEPYTVQHLADFVWQLVAGCAEFAWFAVRHYTSKAFRVEQAREYNRAMFGNVPTDQIYVLGIKDEMRPLREDERAWPE